MSVAAIMYLLGCFSLLVTFVAYAAAFAKRGRVPQATEDLPPITVLKPIKGVDEGLAENLDALAQQDYPRFEILIAIANPRDEAMVAARAFVARHPHVDIRVVSGAPDLGLNPKVSNVRFAAERAAHDLILISDANVRPSPSYLRDMVAEYRIPNTGLVSSLLCGQGETSLGAMMENAHLNAFIAGGVVLAHLGRHPAVIGKSMLFARSHLEALGGFAVVKDVLAEDYILGRLFHQAGYRVALSGHVLPNYNHRRTVAQFCERHLRWSQMRYHIARPSYLAEPLLNPTVLLGLAWLLALATPASDWRDVIMQTTPLAVITKLLGDVLLTFGLRGHGFSWRHAVGLLLKDLLVTALWLLPVFWHRVNWRGRVMRIGADSRLFPLEPNMGAPAENRTL